MPGKSSKAVKGRKSTTLSECGVCPAVCCHDLSIPIIKPKTLAQMDALLWQLNYDTVGVYVRSRRWYLLVKGRCRYLGDDHLCTIYEDRFDNCRAHKPPVCEWYDEWYDILFTTPEELRAYLTAQRKGSKPPIPKSKWISPGAGRCQRK